MYPQNYDLEYQRSLLDLDIVLEAIHPEVAKNIKMHLFWREHQTIHLHLQIGNVPAQIQNQNSRMYLSYNFYLPVDIHIAFLFLAVVEYTHLFPNLLP